VLALEGSGVVGGEAVGEVVGRALQARDLGTGEAAAGTALLADLFPEDVLDLASGGSGGEDDAGVVGVVPPVDETSGDMGLADGVAGLDQDAMRRLKQGLGDLLLLGPPVDLEDVAGIGGGVGAVSGIGPMGLRGPIGLRRRRTNGEGSACS